MSHYRKPAKRQIARVFYRWHRRIGVSAALFVVWLVISGLLLNHSDKLQLDKVELHSPALAHWYHLDNALPQTAYPLGTHWLVQHNDQLLLDGKPLTALASPVIAVAASNQLLAIASTQEIILLDNQGQLIDKLNGSSLPVRNIAQLGSACDGIVVSDGQHNFATRDGLDWQACGGAITVKQPQALTDNQRQQLRVQLTPAVSLEKLLLDLHTGHFFGTFGALVVDTVALGLLLLALSGLWLFFRMGKKPNRQAHH